MRRTARRTCATALLAAGLAGPAAAPAMDGDMPSMATAATDTQAAPFGAPVADDRVYFHALFNELEGRFGDGADPALRWDGEAWAGTDANRLWFKTQGELQDGRVGGGDQELLYDRPVSAFFDLQAGLRYDLDSRGGRAWAALGIEGLAPQFFQLSATLYASDGGHFAAQTVLSYDLLLTQRLVLQPLLEANAYTRADPARDVPTGVPDLEAGLRLRYEFSRKLAPYLGVVYERSAGLVPGLQPVGWRLALGLRTWY